MRSMIRFYPMVFVVLFAFVAFTTTTEAVGAERPKITNFKISPDEVTDSSVVTFSFDFENLAGGMKDATFSLEYEGSISMDRRSSRLVGRLERAQERKWSDSDATSGHFRARARYKPRGEPPYTTTYFVKICAGNGQCSKEASADIKYVE